MIEKIRNIENDLTNLRIEYEKLLIELNNKENKLNEIKISDSPEKEFSNKQTHTEDLLDKIEYACNNCIYVADHPEELGWHNKGEHGLGDPDYEFNYACRICRKPFDVKDELMYHIKYNHEKNMPLCKYFQEGSCNFSDDICWYRHMKKNQVMSTFKCGYCGVDFKSKNEFMVHRKEKHQNQVKICIKYKNDKCEFDAKCWYHHKDETSIMSNLSEYSLKH